MKTDHHGAGSTILVVEDDVDLRATLKAALTADGHQVLEADDEMAALEALGRVGPHLILYGTDAPRPDGLGFLERLRTDRRHRRIPVILLTSRDSGDTVVRDLALGRDDYLTKPVEPAELRVRVAAKLARPVPSTNDLVVDRATGLATQTLVRRELEREHQRHARGGANGVVAVLTFPQPSDGRPPGTKVGRELRRHAASRVLAISRPLETVGQLEPGELVIIMPDTTPSEAERRLDAMARRVSSGSIEVRGEHYRLAAATGYALLSDGHDPDEVLRRARTAVNNAVSRLELLPQGWTPAMDTGPSAHVLTPWTARERTVHTPRRIRLRTPIQLAVTLVVGLVLPFFVYWQLELAGYDITWPVYLLVVASLATTGALIWLEGWLARGVEDPPEHPAVAEPRATAIITAHLPDEATTILETLAAFQRLDYPDLEIIVAYDTLHPLAVEAHLREVARDDPRVIPLRVRESTTRAHNVNAGIERATGAFVGIFDADHHPATDAFRRAWRSLSHGVDVVQGHCLIRNGSTSQVARLVAVEYEAIYAASHPGRARMHTFGVFSGSNGFWRTEVLHAVLMHTDMLTEDIDSSMRVVEEGGLIGVDPGLISRQLAPETWRRLWHQRVRRSQGWFGVSLRHLTRGLRSRELTTRQKLGLVHLLGWREVAPWVNLQVIPLIAYWIWRGDGLDWLVPIVVGAALFFLSVGPAQTWCAYRFAHADVRRHRWWFVSYLVQSTLYYTELNNVIARVGQLKELTRERSTRTATRTPSAPASEAPHEHVPRRADRQRPDGSAALRS